MRVVPWANSASNADLELTTGQLTLAAKAARLVVDVYSTLIFLWGVALLLCSTHELDPAGPCCSGCCEELG